MTPPVTCGVVGHVEWVEFAQVAHVPAPGEIVHARETWQETGGGGAVAAVQLRKLAGASRFITALGDDDLGHRAHAELTTRYGVAVDAVFRPEPQRRAFTFVDDGGERTITVMGERLVPRAEDPVDWATLEGADGVYFTGGDTAALARARAARVLVATTRALPVLREGRVALDALVASATDAGERYEAGELDPPPRLVVLTHGAQGGEWRGEEGRTGRWAAAELPGPIVDAYGAGDSFAAGLTFALAAGHEIGEALELASRCGAACLTGRGPYAGQLTLV